MLIRQQQLINVLLLTMPQEKWQQELTQCIRTIDQLEKYIPINNREEVKEILRHMRLSITPHALKLIDFTNPHDPLLLMSVPQEAELRISPEELTDPIGDETLSSIPFLKHGYPDRVLIFATFFCSMFCRFCFRRTKTGKASPGPTKSDVDRIVNYLTQHPEVEEVIFTGGDPFTLMDWQLKEWLDHLQTVTSIRRIRFHTRTLVNLPSRVTDSLVDLLKRSMNSTHPIYIVTHFNHPREVAQENIEAVSKLVDAGIIVRNQGTLLKGINDDPSVLEELFKRLVDIRVVPYYLHQLDLAKGTNHFRVPIERGIAIMRSLQGSVTGIALPRFMLNIPGRNEKIPLTYPFAKNVDNHMWDIESPAGEHVLYKEPH